MSKKYPPQQSGAPKKSEDFSGSWQLHTPVLLEPVLEFLNPKKDESYLDLTAGFGGHAIQVINKTKNAAHATLVDRDETAIVHLEKSMPRGVRLLQRDFASAAEALANEGRTFDMVLVDLGVSSPQLDKPDRGFSFQADAPLDMRMDQRGEITASSLVNQKSLEELGRIIQEFGEEKPGQARRIAKAIVANRPIETTAKLAEVIIGEHRGRWQKTHPATRTFQALRIAVNDELGQLASTLPLLPRLLNPGGRVAIISFHNLEDRLVKQFLNEHSRSGYEATLSLLNKKPISGASHDVHNPRARSAKLRAAVKINKKRKDLDNDRKSSRQVSRG